MSRTRHYAELCLLAALALAATTGQAAQLVRVPAQTFTMGDNTGLGRPDQLPAHTVTLTSYEISPHMVTARAYCDFLNASDWDTESEEFIVRKGGGDVLVNLPYSPIKKSNGRYEPKANSANLPMYYVTWEGAALYCNWLSEKHGKTVCYDPNDYWACDFQSDGYHLPTEAQWECAARGGKDGRLYPWGRKADYSRANYGGKLGRVAPVGSCQPNSYGLYDMPGNVKEWCNDWYKFEYYSECESGVRNPIGPTAGGFRVIRGAAYYDPEPFLACAYRYGTSDTKGCFALNGFRVVREAPATASKQTLAQKESKATAQWLNAFFAANAQPPISLSIGGKRVTSFTGWKRSIKQAAMLNGKRTRTLILRDPKSKIELACEVTTFKDFPAVDWLLRVTNTGEKDSPLIQDVRVLDGQFSRPAGERREFILRHSRGSRALMLDFAPTDELLGPNAVRTFTGHGGRSSDQTLPFMNLSWGNGGAVVAVGWSGQWMARFTRDNTRNLHVQSGMQHLRAKLHPGESIRTPRMLLLFWNGEDVMRGHNQFRKLILAHYNPRIDGKLVIPPIAQGSAGLNEYNEANQLWGISRLKELGHEVHWIDAGWFVGKWPNGAGTWTPRPECFPNGLGPIGDAAHAAGLKFLVWFEPERVSKGSRIEREFPQWTIGPITEYGGLFNWGIPEARKWMTDLLSDQITKGGIDIFRADFNMEPLWYWQRNDRPDRQGITEIRFVEGMYQMWDDLRARHPGLWVDNCASGGRLIDLETTSRSIPLWQSDAQCERCPDVTSQLQNAGLNLYLPMHCGGNFGIEPSYSFRSAMMSGNPMSTDLKNTTAEEFRPTIEMFKMARPFFEGDYYPLFAHKTDETMWYGYQLDRPDLGKGMVVVFRRSQAAATAATLYLRGMDPKASYSVWNKDTGERAVVKGSKMRTLTIRMPANEMPGSRVVFYEKQRN